MQKSGQLKNESKSELFTVPSDAQENTNGTAINAFDVNLMAQFRMHLVIHLELHFTIYIKMYKKVHLIIH